MRSFVLVAAAAALIAAALDGCARPAHPLRPQKEPHVQAAAPASTGQAPARRASLSWPP